jgi:AraC-like DNA-binding protein
MGWSLSRGESLAPGADPLDTRTSALIARSSGIGRICIEAAQPGAYRGQPMDLPINALFERRQREIGALVEKFSSGEGIHPTAIPGLHCIRLSAPHLQLPTVYRPSICVIVQGAKQVLLGEEIYRYAPPQFLAVSVDLPLVGQVIEASREAPYLCLAIDLDARQIADLIEPAGVATKSRGETSRGVFVGELDGATQEAVLRLARLLETPRDIPVLAPMILREFHFRILGSPHGASIAQMAITGSHTHRIGQIIHRIKSQLAAPIRVEELASLANMSRSSFHAQFKAVTAMSPVQYQKRLRLTEARHILLAENADAASAAYRVGYQSVSQFSREYARMFGAPPMRDVGSIRRVSAPE